MKTTLNPNLVGHFPLEVKDHTLDKSIQQVNQMDGAYSAMITNHVNMKGITIIRIRWKGYNDNQI